MIRTDLRTIARISIFASLITVAEYVEGFIPGMRNGGTIEFTQIIIAALAIIIAFESKDKKHNFKVMVNSAAVAIIVCFSLGLFKYAKSPLVFLLDYAFPFLLPTFIVWGGNKFAKTLGLTLGLGTLVLVSHTISGIVAFKVPLNVSLIYNATYVVPTIILELLVVAILLKRKVKI